MMGSALFEPPLGLVAITVRRVHEPASMLVVEVRAAKLLGGCAFCGGGVVGNGSRIVRVRDVPTDCPVVLEWRRRRFLCRDCGRSSVERSEAVDEARAVTTRFKDWIAREGLSTPLTQIAARSGADEATIRRVFRDGLDSAERRAAADCPKTLSLCRVRVAGPYRPALVDPDRGVIEVFKDLDELSLAVERWSGIETLIYPPDRDYRNAASWLRPKISAISRIALIGAAQELLLREARILLGPARSARVDQALLTRSRSTLGRRARERVDLWRKEKQELYDLYTQKERFSSLWNPMSNEREARAAYETWISAEGGTSVESARFVEQIEQTFQVYGEDIFTFYRERLSVMDAKCQAGLERASASIKRTRNFSAVRALMLAGPAEDNDRSGKMRRSVRFSW